MKIATCFAISVDRITIDFRNIFQQEFEVSSSMRLEGPNGITSPFPAGRYEVELYLKTEELGEHFVMRRTLDVR